MCDETGVTLSHSTQQLCAFIYIQVCCGGGGGGEWGGSLGTGRRGSEEEKAREQETQRELISSGILTSC